MVDDCVFCKIIRGELDSEVVYDNDHAIAFLDINPIHDGHTLVIPKEHHKDLYDLPDEVLSEVMKVVKKVAVGVKKAVNADGVNIGMNNELAAGQVVFHAHFHVIPRYEGDGLKHWGRQSEEEPQLKEVANKLKAVLS